MKNLFTKKSFVIAGTVVILGLLFVILHPGGIRKPGLVGGAQQVAIVHLANLPVRLKIPSIAVDAAVENVGVTSGGAMDTPQNSDNVGWFDLNARPGEIGSAVIAGHLDARTGAPAVFANLNKLRPGDKVSITDDQGKIISFVVRESRLYDANADAKDVFSSASGTHLNLITCNGSWDKSKKSYTQRLVVFTDLVN